MARSCSNGSRCAALRCSPVLTWTTTNFVGRRTSLSGFYKISRYCREKERVFTGTGTVLKRIFAPSIFVRLLRVDNLDSSTLLLASSKEVPVPATFRVASNRRQVYNITNIPNQFEVPVDCLPALIVRELQDNCLRSTSLSHLRCASTIEENNRTQSPSTFRRPLGC